VTAAFSAVGPSSSGASSATSPLTFNVTCNAGDTVLLAGVSCDAATDTGMTLSATYNGVAMTSLAVRHSNDQTAGFLQVWQLDNPPTGSPHNVVVTETGGSGLGGLNGGGISCSGSVSVSAAQTAAGSGTAPALAFTGSSAGNVVVAFATCGSAMTPSGSFTSRFNDNAGTGQAAAGYAAGSTIAGGGTVTASWTSASDWWAVIAVEVQGLPPAGVGEPAAWSRPWAAPMTSAFGPAAPFSQPQAFSVDAPPALAVNAGAAAVTASAPAPATSHYITGLAGTGAGYFTDNAGLPRMVLGDAVWALCGNVGRWSSGAWQADYDTYLATRAGQGFTVVYTKPMGTVQSGNIDSNGGTFDSLFPFQGGTPSTGVAGANPSSGLTSSYWARIDYFLASALAKGITVFLNAIGYSSDFDSGPGPLAGKSGSEFQSYGAAIGARYASQPNLVWMVADDYFGDNDSLISSFLTGLRGAGAAQPVTIENYPETTSRRDDSASASLAWGAANGQFNFCYSYNVTYFMIEKAYLESSPVTVIQGDGYFYQGSSSYSTSPAYDRAARQDAWHALSSGARGIIIGDEAVWQWASTAQASVANNWWQKNSAGKIRAAIEALPGWHLLVPDTSSALVTAGRGTHATGLTSGGGGGQYEPAVTDSYVTASRTPDGGSGSSLALVYLSHATTITIDQTKMAAGYTASWMDPVTGALTGTAPGSTYTSSGSNSQGEPDWALVLQAPGAGVSATAGVAAVSAAAMAPVAAVGSAPGVASALALAPAGQASAGGRPGVASSLAVSLAGAAAASALPGIAAAVSAALAASAAATAGGGVAVVTAAAPGATVNTSGSTSAVAGVASVSTAAAGAATAVAGTAGAASVPATALAPATAHTVAPAAAVVTVTAPAAAGSASGSTSAAAGVAAVSASAVAPVAAPAATPGAATVLAAARGPSLAVTAGAAAAAVLARGLNMPPQVVFGRSTAAGRAATTATASGGTATTAIPGGQP
jgi:uncharacterized protein DUF4038/collagenase-like protein with putative collagen-binding domain